MKKTSKCLWCDCSIVYDTTQKRGKYCNSQCCADHKSARSAENNLKKFKLGLYIKRSSIYQILVDRDGNKCQKCGITEWQGLPIRFWVDHIDGNAANRKPSNFRLVCLNCDSQSDTFGGKNRGSGRRSRGLSKDW